MTEDAPNPVSPKVKTSTLASFAAGIILAVIGALTAPQGQEILGGLPSWASYMLLAVLPTVATFAAGFLTNDPLRTLGFQARHQGRHEAR